MTWIIGAVVITVLGWLALGLMFALAWVAGCVEKYNDDNAN